MSRIAEARAAAARKNGDAIALKALMRVRQAAYVRGFTRRKPSVRYAQMLDSSRQHDGPEIAVFNPGQEGVFSGPRPSWRDPQPLGRVLTRVVARQGWQRQIDVASVRARWPHIVGETVARHALIEDFTDDGVLTIRASSASWASQLKALIATLRSAIEKEVGRGIVTTIRILGPKY